jgi:hypothetical protein
MMTKLTFVMKALLGLMVVASACQRAPEKAPVVPPQPETTPQPVQPPAPLAEQPVQLATQDAENVQPVTESNETPPTPSLPEATTDTASTAAPVQVPPRVLEWASITTDELSRVCGPGVGLGIYEDYKILDFHTDMAQATLAMPGLPTGAMARTMGAMCRALRAASNTTATITRQGTMGEKQLFALAIGPQGALKFWGYNADVDSNAKLEVGRWHHVAVTYDGKVATVYLDGKAKHTQYLNLATPEGPLMLGGHGFRGSIAEVQVWDRALSPDMMKTMAERACRAAYKPAE